MSRDCLATSTHSTTTAVASDHDAMSPCSVKRCSITSIQTLPSDCTAEDLSAIQAALLEDDDHQEEEQAMSMALAQQLLREELGLDPLPGSSSLSSFSIASTLYEVLTKLDEVQGDVKSENWQMLAPSEIDKLPVFAYNRAAKHCNTVCPSGCDDKCLICQQDYVNQDSLRKMRCGHFFHVDCVDPWLLKHDFCPVCRRTIDEE
jgi:Ring finger domain